MTLKPTNTKDNSSRKYAGGGPRPDNNDIKRREAAERLNDWSKLSFEQQLKALDSRPGESKRQRERLVLLIEKRKHASAQVPKGAEPVGQLIDKNVGERIKAKDRRASEQAKRPSR